MDIVLLILLILVLLALVFLYGKWQSLALLLQDQAEDTADNLSDQLGYQLENATLKQQQAIHQEVERLRTELYQQLTDIRQELNKSHLETRDATDRRLQAIQESNEKHLEEMRQTVEEKLEKTLQTRLQASFETVSKQLESVNRGLGEMQTVARDVGSLNKVLSGTKTRGIMGELQLGQIIEDILTPSQYEREFATVSGSSERVEYAVKLPGQTEGDYIYLPIDSKFPLADYYRLEDAYESGDKDQIDLHRKNLLAAIKRFAKDIQSKYLNPPETTNFGVLFLPTEGLYSEVVRNPIFFDDLRRQENIVIAGPTTLSALLNSLSVGFKTLNIQRSADDISKVLGNVKLEFGKFSDLLLKAQKQLNQASSNIDKLLTTRTNAIERSLRAIDLYEDDQTKGLLGLSPLDEEDNEN
ncbi:TPA: DNA recombination protein RmuC [Streptococcus suis]|jgi:DNA recombination protein RmuC|uniref:DNA recombination protein RmuC n=1 Tax=Streptococcus parasuis TaxID=1501662 RepID=UPI0023796C5C|nr:DNA recombination protein RmuC [Streptococcus parasuis]HEM3650886.1 DNA recombination protein RmuC [Streptococcus suis]WDN58685.1 DNA recombination protein RmuC [Streptococcus parasuis]WDN60535.1 DNA recombination protein RmuC [Streptococcus parasuis]HEM3659249.1 DNA recombination protein RmuC [Streptococcus suis]HEM3664768.1 DNA recombination protein RmuC [Streptococcus suis]